MRYSFSQKHPVIAYVATVAAMFLALVMCLSIPAYATHADNAAQDRTVSAADAPVGGGHQIEQAK